MTSSEDKTTRRNKSSSYIAVAILGILIFSGLQFEDWAKSNYNLLIPFNYHYKNILKSILIFYLFVLPFGLYLYNLKAKKTFKHLTFIWALMFALYPATSGFFYLTNAILDKNPPKTFRFVIIEKVMEDTSRYKHYFIKVKLPSTKETYYFSSPDNNFYNDVAVGEMLDLEIKEGYWGQKCILDYTRTNDR